MTDPVWGNRFNWCVLAAGFLAASEGRINDSRYVQKLTYELFEDGAFRDRVPSSLCPSSPTSLTDHPSGLSDPES